MPTLQTLIAFFGISVVLGFTPGPDNVFVLIESARRGPRAGITVVLGLCLGLMVHTTAVALGLAALVAASPAAFTVLKLCGAAYLAWLAWQAFRAPVGQGDAPQAVGGGAWQMVRKGVLMNLTNPKVVIFFLAFLPQFVAADRGPVATQIAVLGGVFIVATLLVFSIIAWFSGAFGTLLLRSPRAQRALNWFAGLVFVGLALRLATSQR